MKSLKYLTFLLTIIFLTNCEKVEEYEFKFGEVQKGFLLDSIYQTDSNGFLYVQFDASSSISYLKILADQNPIPSTEIARISWKGSVTLPLQKDIFWIVENHAATNPGSFIKDTLITWTPIE